MSSQKIIYNILRSDRTVFKINTVRSLSPGSPVPDNLSRLLSYYRKSGLLESPRAGIYVKPGYSVEEMSAAIFTPTYISLNYVLSRAGVVFQYDPAITCIGTLSRTVEIDGQTYRYQRIKPEIWMNFEGIRQENGYAIATPERALLDTMYLNPSLCYFDNLSPLDKEAVMRLLPLYEDARLSDRVIDILPPMN